MGLRNQVNAQYSGVPAGLAEQLLAHGGRSGKFGQALRQSEYARLGGLSGVDTSVAQMALDQQGRGSDLAERLLGLNFESEGSDSGVADQSGTGVGAGDALAGGVASGASSLSSLMSLLQLQKLLGRK